MKKILSAFLVMLLILNQAPATFAIHVEDHDEDCVGGPGHGAF